MDHAHHLRRALWLPCWLVAVASISSGSTLLAGDPIFGSSWALLQALTTGGEDPSPVVAKLRIPRSVVVEHVNRTFQQSSPVNRVILGTHSQGTALCTGTVTCDLQDNPHGTELICRVEGDVRSTTTGRNGPAIIRSSSFTTYQAHKHIFFDGKQFTAGEIHLTSCTKLHVTGVDSALPALRGRIVRRVANRRVAESHAEAEAIAAQLTKEELCRQIDAEIERQVADMNRELAVKLPILGYFIDSGHELKVRSFQDCIEIGLVSGAAAPEVAFIALPPVGEKIELWLPVDGNTWISLAHAVTQLPNWVADYFARGRQSPNLDDPQLNVSRYQDWLVFQLKNP